MLVLKFNPFPEIITDRLVLRQLNQEDVKETFILRSDERVLKYLHRSPSTLIDEAVRYIEEIRLNALNNEAILWAISFKDDPKLVGSICYWNIQKENYRAEIGFVLLPEYQKKGIMNESIQAVLNYGFNEMHLHSIEAIVNPDNKSSIQLLERNNFTREAYFKENYFYDGNFYDTAIYSILSGNK